MASSDLRTGSSLAAGKEFLGKEANKFDASVFLSSPSRRRETGIRIGIFQGPGLQEASNSGQISRLTLDEAHLLFCDPMLARVSCQFVYCLIVYCPIVNSQFVYCSSNFSQLVY